MKNQCKLWTKTDFVVFSLLSPSLAYQPYLAPFGFRESSGKIYRRQAFQAPAFSIHHLPLVARSAAPTGRGDGDRGFGVQQQWERGADAGGREGFDKGYRCSS